MGKLVTSVLLRHSRHCIYGNLTQCLFSFSACDTSMKHCTIQGYYCFSAEEQLRSLVRSWLKPSCRWNRRRALFNVFCTTCYSTFHTSNSFRWGFCGSYASIKEIWSAHHLSVIIVSLQLPFRSSLSLQLTAFTNRSHAVNFSVHGAMAGLGSWLPAIRAIKHRTNEPHDRYINVGLIGEMGWNLIYSGRDSSAH